MAHKTIDDDFRYVCIECGHKTVEDGYCLYCGCIQY